MDEYLQHNNNKDVIYLYLWKSLFNGGRNYFNLSKQCFLKHDSQNYQKISQTLFVWPQVTKSWKEI